MRSAGRHLWNVNFVRQRSCSLIVPDMTDFHRGFHDSESFKPQGNSEQGEEKLLNGNRRIKISLQIQVSDISKRLETVNLSYCRNCTGSASSCFNIIECCVLGQS